jgi:type III restriction enzyme
VLAHELAADGLLPDAGKKAHAEMHRVLDGARLRYAAETKKASEGVLTVEGKTVRADLKTKVMSFNDFVEAADYAVIEDAYKRAARVISPDLARTYSEHLAKKEHEDTEDALIEAHTVVAALGLVPDIKDYLEAEAEELSNQWLIQFRVAIKSLSDERQEVYRQIRELSADPLDVDLARPNIWLQPTTAREPDGQEVELPRFERHLLCDEDGLFPEYFRSSWEPKVLLAELQRPGSIAWYRNPSRASQNSLGMTYEDGTEVKILPLDFIFFAQRQNGTIVADIVDPHGMHFGDALPRLRGLARYAEENPGFRRIEVVAQVGNKFRTIDLTEAPARAAVLAAKTVREVYEHDVAIDYSA